MFSVCDADMYRCADDQANPVCLPQSSICNVVVECNKDESNCHGNSNKSLIIKDLFFLLLKYIWWIYCKL